MEGGARWATVHGVTIVSLLCGQASLGNSCSVYIFCFTHGCPLHLYPTYVTHLSGASLVAQRLKRLPARWETQVQSLGWEKSPGEGNGNPLQYSCLENPMDGGAW